MTGSGSSLDLHQGKVVFPVRILSVRVFWLQNKDYRKCICQCVPI